MMKPIQAMLYILQGKVILSDDTLVPVIKRPYPIDKTPCITIDNSSGTSTYEKLVTNEDLPIPEDHPQYIPGEKNIISQQVVRTERGITLEISLWCDTEHERQEIIDKIQELFKKADSDHYMYCANYHENYCNSLEMTCMATTMDTGRTVKKQCPKPIQFGYKNVFTLYDIIRSTFDVEPAYDLDDYTTTQPVLRSIIKVTFNYYDYNRIGGAISQNIKIHEELL